MGTPKKINLEREKRNLAHNERVLESQKQLLQDTVAAGDLEDVARIGLNIERTAKWSKDRKTNIKVAQLEAEAKARADAEAAAESED